MQITFFDACPGEQVMSKKFYQPILTQTRLPRQSRMAGMGR